MSEKNIVRVKITITRHVLLYLLLGWLHCDISWVLSHCASSMWDTILKVMVMGECRIVAYCSPKNDIITSLSANFLLNGGTISIC